MFNLSYRKVGGLRFLRIGRLQFSFCVCRAKPAPKPAPKFAVGTVFRSFTPAEVRAYHREMEAHAAGVSADW
jgi:hypothetical protein